jgi:hypothetical protein
MNIKPYRSNEVIRSEEQIKEAKLRSFKNDTLNNDMDRMMSEFEAATKPTFDETNAFYFIIKFKSATKTYIYEGSSEAWSDYKLVCKTMISVKR